MRAELPGRFAEGLSFVPLSLEKGPEFSKSETGDNNEIRTDV